MVCLIEGQFGWKRLGGRWLGTQLGEGQGKRVGKIREYLL